MCVVLVVLQRRSDWRLSQQQKKGRLEEKEVEELLRDWKAGRMPLGGVGEKSGNGESVNGGGVDGYHGYADVGSGLIVDRINGCKLYLHPDSKTPFCNNDPKSNDATVVSSKHKQFPTAVLNFATHDYLSTSSSPTLRQTALSSLSHYGCGSCGPRGFYGTIDAHLELEQCMSEFLQTESAILYSDGASATTSTVAAFAKRGDLLIVDEGVNEALLVGVSLSRANVRYFRHNDMKDLRRILEKVRAQDVALKRKPTDQRRFLVVEGLYKNWGTLAPLKEIVALKEEFHYRLIVDDSHGIGTLGKSGRGSLEHAGLKPMVHAEIVTFSIENAFGSVGGMTIGSEEVVDHQRLSGAGYCFSASAPPFLSKVCVASVKRLQGKLEDDHTTTNSDATNTAGELAGEQLLNRLGQSIANLYSTLTNSSHPDALKLRNRLVITSNPISPILYLRLSDQEATRRTRSEQTLILDQIAHHSLVEGKVAVVSTGGHVKKFLQLVPEPCLRVVANASQSREDVEELVKALGEAVEAVLCKNVFGLAIIDENK